MSRDGIILVAILLIISGIAAFVLIGKNDVPESDLDRKRTNIFEEDRENTQRPNRVKKEPQPTLQSPGADVDLIIPEEMIEKITAVDDFGVMFAAVEVYVRDAEGNPMPDAHLELFAMNRGPLVGAQRGGKVKSAKTDEKGIGRIDSIEASLDYSLRVVRPGFRRFEFNPLELNSGEVKKLVATLTGGVTLNGVVVEKDSQKPVPGAAVTVFDINDPTGDPLQSIELTAVTDDKGQFEIKGVRLSPKKIVATKSGFGSATLPFVSLQPGRAPKLIKLELQNGQSIAGIVRDVNNRPLDNARVDVTPVKGSLNSAPNAWYPPVTTDGEGRFRAEGLLPGRYVLRASKVGYAPGNFSTRNGSAIKQRMSMANALAGDDGVELTLGPGPTVSGIVIDAKTKDPIPAFDIFASSIKDPRRLNPTTRQRVVSSDGQFDYGINVVSTQARFVYLHVRAPGYAGGRLKLDFAKDKLGMTGLHSRLENVTVEMERGATIRGRLIDGRGRGIGGARITAQRKLESSKRLNPSIIRRNVQGEFGERRFGSSKDDGSFEIVAVPDGKFRLIFEHSEYADIIVPDLFEVAGDDIDVGAHTLRLGGSISGVVLKDDGTPEEGARVSLFPKKLGATKTFTARTGLSGRFSFAKIPAGEFLLIVTERGGYDTRSALYQALKKKKPDQIEVTIEEGVVMSFDLKN